MRRLNLQGVFMKSWSIQGKIYIAILAVILNISFADVSYSASKSVKPQLAGRTATSVSNTILNGMTSPKSTQGINGDFFIDTKALTIYGPKASGRWPVGISLRGTQGVAGTTGTSGSNGTDGRNAQSASAVVGAQGATGAAGIKGEAGAQGATGATGGAGIAGAAGTTGAQGVAGATGSAGIAGAQGSPGATGNTGAQGLKGETGTAGAEGSKGETGTVGATGPSSALDGAIASWVLSTATPGSWNDSAVLRTLAANTSYRVSIIVHGTSTQADGYFGFELIGCDSACTSKYDITNSYGKVFISSTTVIRYTFSIEGTIIVGGSGASITVRAIDGMGVTGTKPLTLSGRAIFQVVGEVTQTS